MPHTPVDPLCPASEPTRHYDSVVEAWSFLLQEDLHYGYFSSEDQSLVSATDALTGEMLDLAALQPGLTVLDVGCGTGKAACRIAADTHGQVTGITPSRACIEGAVAAAAAAGQAQATHFCLGDGTAMAFAANSFDRVWVLESSHLMADKNALLEECSRVLKPGGRLVLCDIMLDHKLSLEQVIDYRDQFLLLRDVFGRAKMETLDFYCGGLEQRGLSIALRRDITAQTLPTFEHWRRNARHNRQQVCDLIGATAWSQFVESCDVLEAFWQQGILGYGILAAEKPLSA